MTALLLGGVGLAVAACGSGGSASTAGAGTSASSSAGSSGAIVSTASVNGTNALASADGHTLYEATAESGGHVLCVSSCTTIWKPLMATQQQAKQASSSVGKTFTVVDRPGGGTQLALSGHPLYTFAEEGPHQMRGNGASDQFGGMSFHWLAAGASAAASSPTSGSGGSGAGGGTGGGTGGGYGGGGY